MSDSESKSEQDAVVVGAGPNGLSAAIRLAQAGQRVLLLEGNGVIGGGARTAELTLPGFQHDVCSAIHPLGAGSPFFRSLPLARHGLDWIHPPACLAHPLDDGSAVVLHRSLTMTASELGRDGGAWLELFGPAAAACEALLDDCLRPLLQVPRHPFLMARFGWRALRPARAVALGSFTGERARALFGGLAAHSLLPLERAPSAAFGLILGILAHAVGWPLPRGGAQRIADALGLCLGELGGRVRTGVRVHTLGDLPSARTVLLDVTPRQWLAIAGDRLPARYRKALARFRYGPGVCKVDYALREPIPWRAAACRTAGTVHVVGSFADLLHAEGEVARGRLAERPFVLLAQPSLFDDTRAPPGRHVAWAYCHVPLGSTANMAERIERQIERFAPGFRDCILARCVRTCADLERDNPNLVGGDINGGAVSAWQLLARPVLSKNPYRTPLRGFHLCSASTPPGGGVHGMCGFHAAEAALRALGR